jgi:hypothetical protein
LTNQHVVEWGNYSAKLGAQVVLIHLGTLGSDGWMQRISEALPAVVHRTSLRQDLALVKLLGLPKGQRKLPVIPPAKTAPKPGQDCVVIGHPAAGTLWTVRSGELSGGGFFPDDQIDIVMHMLRLTRDQRRVIEQALRRVPERKRVLVSDCGLDSGDSGGPLVNEKGELIGVSYAIPAVDPENLVRQANFSFHVHLQEVRQFLTDWPATPEVGAPRSLPLGTLQSVADRDGDDRIDTLLLGFEPRGKATGLLLDLDGDSFEGKTRKELKAAGAELRLQDFDYEFAASRFPRVRLSFDTDNDGSIDLALSDENQDHLPDTVIKLENDRWTITELTTAAISAAPFRDSSLNRRLEKLAGVVAGSK